MASYEAFDEDVEVKARSFLAIVDDALARFSEEYRQEAHEALAANGIVDPDPEEWYPQQAWLNALKAIADELEPHILDRVGEQIPDLVDWPGGISEVPEGLRSIDEAYQRNHRGGDIGYYRFEPLEEEMGQVVAGNPYPCPFDRGLIRAVARQYAPVQSFVFVEERGEKCRREGDDTCTYTVCW